MDEYLYVRCLTCNKVLADKWNTYQNYLQNGVSPQEALNKLGLTRPCCRMRLISPFKVPLRVEKQLETGMNNSSMQVYDTYESNETTDNLMIEPTVENPDIVLAPIPDISSIPTSKETKSNRTYFAL